MNLIPATTRLLWCERQSSIGEAKLFVEAEMPLRAAGVTTDDLHYCFVPGRIEFLTSTPTTPEDEA